MVDYAAIVATSAALIDEFSESRVFTLITKVAGDYNPQTNTKTQLREDRVDFTAVQTNFKKRDQDGTRIRSEDKMLLFTPFQDGDGNEVTPTTSDLIEDGAKKLKIVDIEVVMTGSTTVLYKVQVRE